MTGCDCADVLAAAARQTMQDGEQAKRNPALRRNADHILRTGAGYAKAARLLRERRRQQTHPPTQEGPTE